MSKRVKEKVRPQGKGGPTLFRNGKKSIESRYVTRNECSFFHGTVAARDKGLLFLPRFCSHIGRLADAGQELFLDMIDRLIQCVGEFLKILLVEENLVLLVFFLSHSLAFGDGNIEILLRFGRLDVEEVGPLSRAHPSGEDFIFVLRFQGNPP